MLLLLILDVLHALVQDYVKEDVQQIVLAVLDVADVMAVVMDAVALVKQGVKVAAEHAAQIVPDVQTLVKDVMDAALDVMLYVLHRAIKEVNYEFIKIKIDI